MIRLYIPTLGRVDRQLTYKLLPASIRKHTVTVVDESEKDAFPDRQVLVCPKGCRGTPSVRKFILDQHDTRRHGPVLMMLDDDLRWATRLADGKLRPSRDQDIEAMFAELDRVLRTEVIHASVLARAQAAQVHEDQYCVRMVQMLGYNVKELRKLPVEYDRGAMEDFDVTLQLLRMGKPNKVLANWTQDQTGSDLPGGCSTYRTPQFQAAWCRRLHELHPEFVKVVTKETKVAWGGGQRTDVNIAWKKAFKSSGAKLPGKEN